MNQSDPSPPSDYDPTYLHSLRELKVILVLFAIFCGWSILVCWLSGYENPHDSGVEIAMVLGMPAWVFWGIFLPWIAVDVVAVWFCFFFMKVDDLGEHSGADGSILTSGQQEADHV